MITIAEEPHHELRVDLSRLSRMDYHVSAEGRRLFTVPAGLQIFAEGATVIVSRPGVRVCVPLGTRTRPA